MAQAVNVNFELGSEVSADPFYSESNIRYLELKKREIDDDRALFAEHDLIETDN